MELVLALQPQSVLDIGSGFGKYGLLCREYLDLWDGRQKYEFVKQIDGVEVFSKYITPIHKFVYNNIYNDDIIKLVYKLDFKYDLVLLIDVLEHIEKNEGRSLLKILVNKNKGILIGTPKNPSQQKDVFDNIYETHQSKWLKEDFETIGECFFIPDCLSFIVYITRDKTSIDNLRKRIRRLREYRSFSFIKKLKKILAHIPGCVRLYNQIKKW